MPHSGERFPGRAVERKKVGARVIFAKMPAQFFDSIDVPTLFAEAWRLHFPLQQLAMSMAVHHAPRMLQLGSAVGEFISHLGRSMLVGCKRSTHFARANATAQPPVLSITLSQEISIIKVNPSSNSASINTVVPT